MRRRVPRGPLTALLALALLASCSDDTMPRSADARGDRAAADRTVDANRLDGQIDRGKTDQPQADTLSPDLRRIDVFKTEAGQPTLSVSPAAAAATVDGAAVALTATLTDSGAPISWSLIGPGALSRASGPTTQYLPPSAGGAGTATVTATAGALSASSTITVSLALTRSAGVVAYAWAGEPTSPSYTPNLAACYNASGGAITATRSAVGTYSMSFEGLSLSSGDVQVSGYYGGARCVAASWSGTTVNVRCYDEAGAPVDSRYTVSVILGQVFTRANVVAYALADDPVAASYTPSPSTSYSAGGAVAATRADVGTYAMTFAGLALSGGTVQVGAYGSDHHCNIGYWSGSTVNVRCYDQTGALADSRYTVSVILNNVFSEATVVAYAWANDHASSSYAPDAACSYNSSGHAITATRSAAGTYRISFAGLNAANKHVKVSAQGGTERCNVAGWAADAVEVRCYSAAGSLADSRYTVMITTDAAPSVAGVAAYAWANEPTSASYTPTEEYSYNSTGGAITARRSAAGTYSVTFASLDLSSGDVQVSGYGYGNSAHCSAASFGGDTANVRCYDAAGVLVDSQYTVRIVLNRVFTRAQTVAYALADNATAASYSPSSAYAHSVGGAITATRSAAGTYTVQLAGLSLGNGDVQVSAYGGDKHCNINLWGGNTVGIRCYDAAGALADSRYTLSIVQNDVFSPASIIAYAWADAPTQASYAPSATYSYNASGMPITATRSATGTYRVSFVGLGLGSGHVKVTGYGGAQRCNVASWQAGAVNVLCYGSGGALADSQYTVLVTR